MISGGAKGGRMDIIRKYAFALVLVFAVIYVYVPLPQGRRQAPMA